MSLFGTLFRRKTKGEMVFDILNILLMLLICFITLYPIWYVIVYSLNDGNDAMRGGIYWWPRLFTWNNYRVVFCNSLIANAFLVSALRTLIGTTLSTFFTAMVAYALSKKELIGRKIYLTVGTITMFFGGGLIPTFLLYKDLHLYNTFLVYIIPTMFNFFNAIIFMSFFREIPPSLEESAALDGANEFVQFLFITIPLSMPAVATIALFNAVFNWNDYFMGVMFVQNPDLTPIQTLLYQVVAQAGSGSNQMLKSVPANIAGNTTTSTSVQMATMVITTLPIVCVYPFLQRYFVKGLTIGSVKG